MICERVGETPAHLPTLQKKSEKKNQNKSLI